MSRSGWFFSLSLTVSCSLTEGWASQPPLLFPPVCVAVTLLQDSGPPACSALQELVPCHLCCVLIIVLPTWIARLAAMLRMRCLLYSPDYPKSPVTLWSSSELARSRPSHSSENSQHLTGSSYSLKLLAWAHRSPLYPQHLPLPGPFCLPTGDHGQVNVGEELSLTFLSLGIRAERRTSCCSGGLLPGDGLPVVCYLHWFGPLRASRGVAWVIPIFVPAASCPGCFPFALSVLPPACASTAHCPPHPAR